MAIGVPVLGTPSQITVASASPATPAHASPAAGDLELLLAASGSGSPALFTNPSGWTLDDQSSSTADTVAPSLFGAHKLAAGTEGTTTLSFAHASGVVSAGIVKVPGVDPTTPVQSATLLDQTAGSLTWTLPNATIANNGSTLVYVASGNNNTSTFTPPAGWTELWDGVSQLAASRAWSIGYKQNVAAGSLGAGVNLGVSNNIRGLLLLYVINPAATTPTKVWNGSAWVSAVRHDWTGSAWT